MNEALFIQIQVGMHTSKGRVGACGHHGVGLGDHQQWYKKCFPLQGGLGSVVT